MVGRVFSKQPPWSTAMSTSTLPGFMAATMASVTSLGAFAPGISTEPMTRSASARTLDLSALDTTVLSGRWYWASRWRSRSS